MTSSEVRGSGFHSNATVSADLGSLGVTLGMDADSGRQHHHDVDSSLDIAKHVFTTIVQPIICVCGILGNILILVILGRYRMRRNVDSQEKVVHIGFCVMALSDTLFCLSLLPRTFIKETVLMAQGGSFSLFYQLNCMGLITMFSLTSSWLIVVTAGIRYVGICHPLKARNIVSTRGIIIACVVICVTCSLGNLPNFWISVAMPMGDGWYFIDLGPFSHNHTRGIVFIWLRAIYGIFIPVVLLVYFNLRLILALRASGRLQKGHVTTNSCSGGGNAAAAASRKREVAKLRLTRTLVAVVLMFVFLVYPCELMDFIAYVAPTSGVTDGPSKEAFMMARVIANFLLVLNFASNFILYCVVNGTFRQEFARMVFDHACCDVIQQHLHLHFWKRKDTLTSSGGKAVYAHLRPASSSGSSGGPGGRARVSRTESDIGSGKRTGSAGLEIGKETGPSGVGMSVPGIGSHAGSGTTMPLIGRGDSESIPPTAGPQPDATSGSVVQNHVAITTVTMPSSEPVSDNPAAFHPDTAPTCVLLVSGAPSSE